MLDDGDDNKRLPPPVVGTSEVDGGAVTTPEPISDQLAPDETDAELSSTAAAAKKSFSRRHVYTLIAPIIALVIANNIGNALAPDLVNSNPLLLIALSAPNRNLIAASLHTPLPLYFLVGMLRLLAPDVFFYALGEHYGETAISWMERRTRSIGAMMRQLETYFKVASWPLVLILPNNAVCLLAGSAKMPKRIFWPLNIVGTLGRLVLMLLIGQAFQDTIDTILKWIAEHRLPLLAISIGFVLFTVAREWKSGTSDIQQLIELEEELEEIEHDADGDVSNP